jgi:hypothetical protein
MLTHNGTGPGAAPALVSGRLAREGFPAKSGQIRPSDVRDRATHRGSGAQHPVPSVSYL